MDIDGKRVWITGASSGIGAATAKALAREGAEVVLSARRRERLAALRDAVTAAGGKARVVPVDVTDRAAMTATGHVLAGLGGVDVLINNAGVMPLSPVLSGRVDEWDRMIDVNLRGALYAIHAVYPGMVERRCGHIVNISSVAARVVFPSSAVYSATKFGVRALSEGLRREALRHQVRVTDIQPGAVDTELPESIAHDRVREAVRKNLYAPGSAILAPADVAAAILYVLTAPDHVDVGELVVRPTIQDQ